MSKSRYKKSSNTIEIGKLWSISKECLESHNIKLLEEIGRGEFSIVYHVKYQQQNEYALKIIQLPIDFGNDFEDEVSITQLMAELDITVPFISKWICKGVDVRSNESIDIGFILTHKWTPLEKFIDEGGNLPHELVVLFFDKINRMHDVGYIHSDPHMGNIVIHINEDDRIDDIAIIDFGLSFNYEDLTIDPQSITDRFKHVRVTSKLPILARTTEEEVNALLWYDVINWF